MPDITMCEGGSCVLKENCYRFKAKPTPSWQAYFNTPPFKDEHNCDYFWKHQVPDKRWNEDLRDGYKE